MAIQSIEFHRGGMADASGTRAVRLVGSGEIIEFHPVPIPDGPDHRIKDGDRLVGWLDVELVLADQEDVEGIPFDILGIASANSDAA